MTLWVIALIFFGAGDFLTTIIGLQLDRVIEVGPVPALILPYGLGPLALLKITFITTLYLIWHKTPTPLNTGIPFGLAILGILVTIWNITIILTTVL